MYVFLNGIDILCSFMSAIQKSGTLFVYMQYTNKAGNNGKMSVAYCSLVAPVMTIKEGLFRYYAVGSEDLRTATFRSKL